MEKVLILGHKNPDTDSICSSIVMEKLAKHLGLDAEAVRLGKVNKESEYVFEYLGIEAQREISKVALSELASLIDENTDDFNRVLPYLSKKFKGLKPSCVVVGCTHYNFVKKQIQTVLPDAKIISCEKEIALQVQRVSKECKFCLTNGSLKVVLTKRNHKLSRFLKTYLSFA